MELLGAVPVVLAVGLLSLQLLAAGYSKVLAGTAAEAGALALAAGADPRAGAREALPGWSRLAPALRSTVESACACDRRPRSRRWRTVGSGRSAVIP